MDDRFLDPVAIENFAAGHVISELGFCVGIRSPLAHMAYLVSVQSRWSRHS
jgi:hypothetical protein